MIYVFCGKGGVGKTTLAKHFTLALNKANPGSTILISVDSQENFKVDMDFPREQYLLIDDLKEDYNRTVEILFHEYIREYVSPLLFDYVEMLGEQHFQMFRLAEYIERNPDMTIVVDFPPNHSGLAVMSLPLVALKLFKKMKDLKRKVAKLLKKTMDEPGIEYCIQVLSTLNKRLRKDSFWFAVGFPELYSVQETKRSIEQLDELSFRRGLLINKYEKNVHAEAMETYAEKRKMPCFKIRFDEFKHIPSILTAMSHSHHNLFSHQDR